MSGYGKRCCIALRPSRISTPRYGYACGASVLNVMYAKCCVLIKYGSLADTHILENQTPSYYISTIGFIFVGIQVC